MPEEKTGLARFFCLPTKDGSGTLDTARPRIATSGKSELNPTRTMAQFLQRRFSGLATLCVATTHGNLAGVDFGAPHATNHQETP